MKKILYPLILVFILSAFKGEAQYHITSVTRIDTVAHPYCDTADLYFTTDYVCTICSLTYIKTYYEGDPNAYYCCDLTSPASGHSTHSFAFPGRYSVKSTLYVDSSGGFGGSLVAYDSVITIINNSNFCHTLPIRIFYDVAGAGVYDSSADPFIIFPVKIEVSKNNIPVDTMSATSGLYYLASGIIGDVYSFRIISMPGSAMLTYPAGGILYDTISAFPNGYSIKYFGLACSGAAGLDLSVNVIDYWSGVHAAYGKFDISNEYCNSIPAVATVNFSPKFVFESSSPAPASVSGNTITWDLTALSFLAQLPITYYLTYNTTTGLIPYGDTLQSHFQVTPTSGDIDLSNNFAVIVDTDKHSHDPNEMMVSPSGYIASGTQLKYTVGFENTGNDTAFNVSIYDTLSDNVDVKSLNIIMASAVMNIATLQYGGRNIVKFDFPNINLLDSSHHGLCDGAVIFTINAKDGLAPGTTIFNHAGIFFDYNPVVMTDTVEDMIGFPAGTTQVNKTPKVTVYPNPASDEVTISADNANYSTATFTNVLGQQVLAGSLTGQQTKMNVSHLAPGMYYITMIGEGGVKVVKFEKM